MPAKPLWLMRIPAITAALAELETPVIDRAVCERLFGVRRRQAIQIMRAFGGYRSGNTILLDRVALIATLAQLAASDVVARECRRKEKLHAELDRLHRQLAARRVQLPVEKPLPSRNPNALPRGVELQPGRLLVRFTTAEDLFARLYELAEMAAADFDGMRQKTEAKTGC